MTPEQAVEILNRFLAIDPEAVSHVFNSRYALKPEAWAAALADPTLIAGFVNGDNEADGYSIGPLGIINGLLGTRDVWAHYGDKGVIVHFAARKGLCDHPTCMAIKGAV